MSESLVLTTPQEYFRDLLGTALTRQNVRVQPDTEFYLVNLLAQFLTCDKLYTEREDGARDTEPLALMLARAMQGGREVQIRTLRQLGDVSLYVSGFFTDSLSRSVVDVDYYVRMGGTAYAKVSELSRVGNLSTLYAELSVKFAAFVDVLSEVAENTAVATNAGVVRLYERFLKTGSTRMARLLGERGVVAQVPPKDGGLKQ
jgi:hypothetical protein